LRHGPIDATGIFTTLIFLVAGIGRRGGALRIGRYYVFCQGYDPGDTPHGNLVKAVLDAHEGDSAEDTKCEKNLRAQGAADFLDVLHSISC
tara:strand:+ start:147 stop:419 length:273 start_codon:yes stop_codon:yes gene_type:complete